MFSKVLLAASVALLVWFFSEVPTNIRHARRFGVPIIWVPVTSSNALWLVFSSTFQQQLQRYLPDVIYRRVGMTIYGWQFGFRHILNEIVPGYAWVEVGPGQNELWITDPEQVAQVLSQTDDFLQLELSTKITSAFGSNVMSTNGDEWRRHRKQVAPALNERIMNAVWREGTEQTEQMLGAIVGDGGGSTNEVINGVRTIAMGVIAFAGFGVRVPWARSMTDDKPPPGHQLSFFQTLSTIVNKHFVALLVPSRLLRKSWMPTALQSIGTAVEEFPKHAAEIMQRERYGLSDSATSNLTRSLVNKFEAKTDDSLTEEEITGNTFIFSIAGFDTTANTMAYAIMHLAMEPELQEWIMEEIRQVAELNPEGSYEKCFPYMKRSIALMNETLRVYTPVLHITRRVTKPTVLRATPRIGEIVCTPETLIYASQYLIHVNEEFWPDPMTFRPQRWFDSKGDLIRPPKGHFAPFSIGGRICPGQKMAQVEFVSVLRGIFSRWQVQAVGTDGQTGAKANAQLRALIDDSRPKVTLQVRELDKVNLRFKKR